MGLLEDLMRTLERVPVWKRLNKVPDELDALRQRVEALERLAQVPALDRCPKCKAATFSLLHSGPDPDPVFAAAGATVDEWGCSSCHYTRTDHRDPG